MTTFGLSQAQAAATLAAILVGTEAGLFSDTIFNGAILTVLFTTLTSPIIVRRFGKRLSPSVEEARKEKPSFERIMVSILSDEAPSHVLDLGAILAHANEGELLPIIIAEDEQTVKERAERFKKEGLTYPDTETELLQRIEPSPPEAILRAAGEEGASMVLMDWLGEGAGDECIAGDALDSVIWEAGVPILVNRLTMASEAQKRVVLVVAAATVGVKLNRDAVDVVEAIAQALDLPLLVLTTSHYADELTERLEGKESKAEVEVIRSGKEIVEETLDQLDDHDQVILTTMGSHDRLATGEGKIPEVLSKRFTGSISILHYP